MVKSKRAQSILEYIIVLSAIIVAVIAATKKDGPLSKAVEQMFNDSSQVITDQSSDFLARVGGGSSAVGQ
ncbi:MAG: hypothetical protein KKH93_06395 [Candidatus Omnitrophica bacterium]|nr:hypothetical protein [Candidatus Omnitrophota bacterium]MBU2044946.1 hypothetical protein [Candidatus Omnitrophota bacterium]MBU2250801.1 hypothetical protein [Candidatus Omnitrophota bacterium]MBU2265911.1 hypothetical protein [Candidatus Omnitrophota bacterium]MBU2473536.1 hypothetical protein [Candidatus Omnitrophota bacterium]